MFTDIIAFPLVEDGAVYTAAEKTVTLLSLRTGRLSVEIEPEAGGSVARFAVGGRDILRPGRGTQGAAYPLVPFSNRIANGRFEFEGRTIEVPRNWPDPAVRHPMHGDGWAAAWRAQSSGPTAAAIAFEHDGTSGWPFRYRASQSFRLENDALTVQMRLENREPHSVPGGMGLHPFFIREPDSELFFDADAVWLADAEVLPTRRVTVPSDWDFCHGRRPDDVALDNCFDGWDGEAAVVWPSRRLRLELAASAPFRHAVVFTPSGRPFFCFEPVSHANGQIGCTHIAAGGALSGEIVFRLSDL
jgi:aldose 1-epimerase